MMLIFLFCLETLQTNVLNPNAKDLYEMIGVNPENYSEDDLYIAIMNSTRQFEQNKEAGYTPAQERQLIHAYKILSDNETRRVYNFYGNSGIQQRDFLYFNHLRPPNSPLTTQLFPIQIFWNIPLSDFFIGKQKTFLYSRRVPCRCREGGFWCDKCRGSPTRIEQRNFTINIEVGGPNNDIFEFPGFTDSTEDIGSGLLVIHIIASPDGNIERKGRDLTVELLVSHWEYLNGFKKKLKLPSGTVVSINGESGYNAITLPGYGIPGYKGGPPGNLIVTCVDESQLKNIKT